MDQRKRIGNVNLLDARKATEQAVAEISEIGNVNVMIVSTETSNLASRLNVGNINAVVEVPTGDRVNNSVGKQVWNKDFLKGVETPFFSIQIGQVIIEPDLPPADFESKITGMVVIGQLICPESLAGLVQSKTQQVIGETVSYPVMEKVVMNSVTLDQSFLQGLKDGSEIAIVGSLTAPKVLPSELVERKIKRLFVSGRVMVHEENMPALQSSLVKEPSRLTVVPAGYALVEKELVLDSMMLDILPSKNLFCTGTVMVQKDVQASQLDAALDKLVCLGKVFCPASLSKSLVAKCDPLETEIEFYEGELWIVEGSRVVSASQLEAVAGKITILVEGVLKFDPEVPADLLAEKIARIDNTGMIQCTREQQDVLETRMRVREGMFEDSQKPHVEEAPKDEHVIGNVNYLTL